MNGYLIITNDGRYWGEGGLCKIGASLLLADLISAGIVTDDDEPEIVNLDEEA